MTAPDPLTRPRAGSVHTARPIFQVLYDDSASCWCHVLLSPTGVCSTGGVMRVSAEDCDQADGVFL